MSQVTYDFSETRRLAFDLTAVSELMPGEVRKTVQQAAIETKKFWASDASRSFPSRTVRGYAPTIDYTLRRYGAFGQSVFEAEVGPNLARYGGITGKGGLIPSIGILEEANKGVRGRARGSIDRAEVFSAREFATRIPITVAESMRKRGL